MFKNSEDKTDILTIVVSVLIGLGIAGLIISNQLQRSEIRELKSESKEQVEEMRKEIKEPYESMNKLLKKEVHELDNKIRKLELENRALRKRDEEMVQEYVTQIDNIEKAGLKHRIDLLEEENEALKQSAIDQEQKGE